MFESFFFSCKKKKNVFDKNFKLFLKIKRFTCKNSMKVPFFFFFLFIFRICNKKLFRRMPIFLGVIFKNLPNTNRQNAHKKITNLNTCQMI